MADILETSTGANLGSNLLNLLNCEAIVPGDNAGYELCKELWEYHPLGGKLVEKPIRMALSKERIIAVDAPGKEMLVEQFKKIWEDLDCYNEIRDVMFINRAYGVAAIIIGGKDEETTDPLDYWKLANQEIYFNRLDPLNLAGSTVTNQNPNAPDFQKPLAYITAAGQPYHPSRSCIVFNQTPIYLSYQSSGFGYVGRSVFQRALYPLKSFVNSMQVDDWVMQKAGLIIAKQKPAGSIVNRFMQTAAGIKRAYLQSGGTGNVLSIDVDEEIGSIDMTNTDTAMKTARDNMIANIATASDVPALLLKDEALTTGFGEGSEDTKAIVQFIDGIREDMRSLFQFMEKIVMHRAWNQEFYESIKNEYPDVYGSKSYEECFYYWKDNFKAEWESLMEEPESEKVKVDDIKLKGLTEMARTLLPVIDQDNRALVIQWMADNLAEMESMFQSTLQLDYDAIAAYEPPTPLPEPEEPKAKG